MVANNEINQNLAKIHLVEKPDWVSWDEIHDVLWAAHSSNRDKGINMRKPGLAGHEIRDEIEPNGKILVALHQSRVVGTAAIVMKQGKSWYDKGLCGYLCFASLLPEYQGLGIYKELMIQREKFAIEAKVDMLSFDTHVRNKHVIDINKKNGFVPVAIKPCSDHFNVVMVKWVSECPYSIIERVFRYWKSILINNMVYTMDSQKGCQHTALYKLAHRLF